MSQITVSIDGDTIRVVSPYHQDAIERFRQLGGRWDGEAWNFPAPLENEVRGALLSVYGTDGTDEAQTVTLIARAKTKIYEYHGPVTCCGKTVARAWGRDSGAKVGDDVALLSGHISSGGSRKNWKTIVQKGSTFKLLNVLPGLADDYDPDEWEVITEDGGEPESPLAGFSDAQILAEARRRGLIDTP